MTGLNLTLKIEEKEEWGGVKGRGESKEGIEGKEDDKKREGLKKEK